MKNCCKKECEKINPQSLENFSPNKDKKDGKQGYCKHCAARIKKQKYRQNPDKYRKQRTEYLEKNKEKAYASTQRWRQENREQIKEARLKYKNEDLKRWAEIDRRAKFKKNYGITIDYYNTMLQEQNFLCAICFKPETATLHGKIRNLCVDHNHQTGQVRGLLCSACNQSLGKLKEDVAIMNNMIEYVQKYKKVTRIA